MNDPRQRNRRASVLLLILLVVAVSVPLALMLLDTHATQIRCVHNYIENMTAIYVAGAGVQRAMCDLVTDPNWRVGYTNWEFPAGLGHTYTVTLQDISEEDILVISTGRTAAGYTKTVYAKVTGF